MDAFLPVKGSPNKNWTDGTRDFVVRLVGGGWFGGWVRVGGE
jgi:hypothetical protein